MNQAVLVSPSHYLLWKEWKEEREEEEGRNKKWQP
jgi:hypothetical protein